MKVIKGVVMWATRLLLTANGLLMLLEGLDWLGNIKGTAGADGVLTSAVTAMLLLDGIALLALAAALAVDVLPKWVWWLGIGLVALNWLGTVTDQIDTLDIVVLALNAGAFAGLVLAAPGARRDSAAP